MQHASSFASGRWRMGLWLNAAIALAAMHMTSMDQDIEFWRSWIWQLQSGGYEALASMWPPANYPPLIQHWFRLLAWILEFLGAAPDSDLLVKAWTLLPVLVSQLVLVELVARALLKQGEEPLRSAVFWLTVANPAILMDGPVWGQIDLMPFLPLYLSMATALDKRKAVWTLPLLAIALLCKFQAIVFVPVVAGLALRHWRRHLPGAVIAALLVWLCFAPFISAGGIMAAMERAYWGNVGAFPYFSLNAANFWFLYAGGSHIQTPPTLLSGDWAGFPLAPWISPSRIGMLIFAAISLYAFARCWRRPELPAALGLAVFTALGFFVFSSAMHERYLFLALPFCALWAAHQPGYRLWYPLLTALVYLNINFVLNLASPSAWKIVAAAMILTFFGMTLQLTSRRFTTAISALVDKAAISPKAPYAALLMAWLALLGFELAHARLNPTESLGETGTRFLSDLKPKGYHQEWGDLRMNTNLQGGPLCIGDRCYERGIATHADSAISYPVPSNACFFKAEAGLDRDSSGGEAQFAVELDGAIVWSSEPVTSDDPAMTVTVEIQGGSQLLLKVDSLGDNRNDHADWANARFEACAD